MLKPSMNELMKRVGNRYLLVNLAAQRARDLSQEAEAAQDPLLDKAVKLALDEIAAGTIVYKPGPKSETPEISYRDIGASLPLSFDDEHDFPEEVDDMDEEENEDDEK